MSRRPTAIIGIASPPASVGASPSSFVLVFCVDVNDGVDAGVGNGVDEKDGVKDNDGVGVGVVGRATQHSCELHARAAHRSVRPLAVCVDASHTSMSLQ
jgi:hypothetical protein